MDRRGQRLGARGQAARSDRSCARFSVMTPRLADAVVSAPISVSGPPPGERWRRRAAWGEQARTVPSFAAVFALAHRLFSRVRRRDSNPQFQPIHYRRNQSFRRSTPGFRGKFLRHRDSTARSLSSRPTVPAAGTTKSLQLFRDIRIWFARDGQVRQLYGSTFWGQIYRYSPGGSSGWVATLLYSFTGPSGSGPSPLTMDSAGNLYGVYGSGGAHGKRIRL